MIPPPTVFLAVAQQRILNDRPPGVPQRQEAINPFDPLPGELESHWLDRVEMLDKVRHPHGHPCGEGHAVWLKTMRRAGKRWQRERCTRIARKMTSRLYRIWWTLWWSWKKG